MGGAGDVLTHAIRGSSSRGPWNKCGNYSLYCGRMYYKLMPKGHTLMVLKRVDFTFAKK